MKRLGKLSPWICSVTLLALGACNDSSPTAPREGRLTLSLALSSTSVAAGEPVTAIFTVRNEGGSPVQLTFGDSCESDITVKSGGGVVWNSLAQFACLTAVSTRPLAPGASCVYRETWDQTTNDGAKVSPGTYQVVGQFRANDNAFSQEVALTVR